MAGALALMACEREAPVTPEIDTGPSIEERAAELAAEQLAALGGPANAEQRAQYQGEFQASGAIDALGAAEGVAEGAWDMTLLEDYAVFSRVGLGDAGGIPGERDYRERGMRVTAGDVIITIMRTECTASGIQLPYTVQVLFDGVSYHGCARRGVEAGERATWASVLPELIPAIDACLARAASRPARVTFASALDEGETSVRIRQANGARHECIVSGEEVILYETLSDVDRRNGEGDPEFVRGGAQPSGERCVQAATSRSGAHLGWIVRRSC